MASLFTDDTYLLAKSESLLQKVVDEFNSCRRKRRLNVVESKLVL